jgi:hypothetical protein
MNSILISSSLSSAEACTSSSSKGITLEPYVSTFDEDTEFAKDESYMQNGLYSWNPLSNSSLGRQEIGVGNIFRN